MIDKVQLGFKCKDCKENWILYYDSYIVNNHEEIKKLLNESNCPYCKEKHNIYLYDIRYFNNLGFEVTPTEKDIMRYYGLEDHDFSYDNLLKSNYETGSSSWNDLTMKDLKKTMNEIDLYIRKFQMSRRKIKQPKVKINKAKLRAMQYIQTILLEENQEKVKRKEADATIIGDMIIDGTLDPYQIEDYKHIKAAARTVDWSAHRMFKAIDYAKVAEVIKKEQDNSSKVTIRDSVFEGSKGETNEPTKKTVPKPI